VKEEGLKTRKGVAGNEVRRENRVKKQGTSVEEKEEKAGTEEDLGGGEIL
jgi:hypothetical protein